MSILIIDYNKNKVMTGRLDFKSKIFDLSEAGLDAVEAASKLSEHLLEIRERYGLKFASNGADLKVSQRTIQQNLIEGN